jgi:hypothetical protein
MELIFGHKDDSLIGIVESKFSTIFFREAIGGY